jgi:hypothetical protein
VVESTSHAPEQEGRNLIARKLINARLFLLLALVATAGSESIAWPQGSIASQFSKWNKCYDAGLTWLCCSSPNIKGGVTARKVLVLHLGNPQRTAHETSNN